MPPMLPPIPTTATATVQVVEDEEAPLVASRRRPSLVNRTAGVILAPVRLLVSP
jgi:hypothetical protein